MKVIFSDEILKQNHEERKKSIKSPNHVYVRLKSGDSWIVIAVLGMHDDRLRKALCNKQKLAILLPLTLRYWD
jgi:hypothetical protein